MNMTVMKEEVSSTHRSLESEGTTCRAKPHEEAPGLVRQQRMQEESLEKSLYVV